MSGTCCLSIAIAPFFAPSAPLSSTPQPPGASREARGYNCLSLAPSCLSLERHFNSPCCTSAFNFSILSSPFLTSASSHVPDPFINNGAALSQHFLPLSVFSRFEAGVRQSFHFRWAPSLRRRGSLISLSFLSTYGISSSRLRLHSSLNFPSHERGNKEILQSSNFLVLTRDL